MTASGEGYIRLVWQTPSGSQRIVIFGEVRTEPLDVSTDPRQQLQVPFGAPGFPMIQDSKIVLEMKGDSSTTVDNNSTIRIPVTIKDKMTNMNRETYLTGADFGLTSSDVTIATTWTVVGTYTVSAAEEVVLGHRTQVNSQTYQSFAYT